MPRHPGVCLFRPSILFVPMIPTLIHAVVVPSRLLCRRRRGDGVPVEAAALISLLAPRNQADEIAVASEAAIGYRLRLPTSWLMCEQTVKGRPPATGRHPLTIAAATRVTDTPQILLTRAHIPIAIASPVALATIPLTILREARQRALASIVTSAPPRSPLLAVLPSLEAIPPPSRHAPKLIMAIKHTLIPAARHHHSRHLATIIPLSRHGIQRGAGGRGVSLIATTRIPSLVLPLAQIASK